MSFYDIQGNYFKEDIEEEFRMPCDEECKKRRKRAREKRERALKRGLFGRINERFVQTNVNVEKQNRNRKRFWFF